MFESLYNASTVLLEDAKMKSGSVYLSCIWMCLACAEEEIPDYDIDANRKLAISQEPLSGVIGGKAWTAAGAIADFELSNDSRLFLRAFSRNVQAPCEASDLGQPSLLLNIPRVEGNYPFSPGINGTFVTNDDQNLRIARGRVVVREAGSESMEIAIVAEFDEMNQVNGEIDVNLCK